jgi:CRISPR-associated endoribonuclease Cas6
MLLSAVVAVSPREDLVLPPSLGRAAHALFLARVAAADAALAAALHADQRSKPFTAAFLEEGVVAGQRQTVCRAGERYHLRFTSLTEPLSALLLERVLPALPEWVALERGVFRVEQVYTTREQHAWAGQDSYQALAAQYLLARAAPPARVVLVFASPTTFRSEGRHVPLPLPGLVFGSLLERWNAFAPVGLEEAISAFAATGLAVSRYRLATRLAALGGGKQVGFVGECEYLALGPAAHELRQVHLLAAYAFYSGVGHKTTMGLGRARVGDDGRALSGRAGNRPA